MALVPIGTDQKLTRVPWVTILIILVNLAVWLHLRELC
jgi:hypothetical protein